MENRNLIKETEQGKSTSLKMFVFKNAHFAPGIQASISVLGTLISFIIAILRDDVSVYLPFISETGAFSPESCIFSMTLILSSFIGVFTIFIYYIVMAENDLNSTDKVFRILNLISVFIGSVAMLGMAGVAAFPMTTVFWAHLLFAGTYFVSSGIYFILVSILTYKSEGFSKKFKLRLALSILIMNFLLCLSIMFPIALVRWEKNNKDVIPALKTPDKEGFVLLLLSSILEWTIVIIILCYFLTLIFDIRNFKFELCATPESAKSPVVIVGPVNPDEN